VVELARFAPHPASGHLLPVGKGEKGKLRTPLIR
jgi:hypothetical protein